MIPRGEVRGKNGFTGGIGRPGLSLYSSGGDRELAGPRRAVPPSGRGPPASSPVPARRPPRCAAPPSPAASCPCAPGFSPPPSSRPGRGAARSRSPSAHASAPAASPRPPSPPAGSLSLGPPRPSSPPDRPLPVISNPCRGPAHFCRSVSIVVAAPASQPPVPFFTDRATRPGTGAMGLRGKKSRPARRPRCRRRTRPGCPSPAPAGCPLRTGDNRRPGRATRSARSRWQEAASPMTTWPMSRPGVTRQSRGTKGWRRGSGTEARASTRVRGACSAPYLTDRSPLIYPPCRIRPRSIKE